MKHLKEYNQFNEGIFGLFGKPNVFDKPIKSLFNRVKDIFNIDNLKFSSDDKNIFNYKLEETDSQTGFIYIRCRERTRSESDDYYLYVDNEEIDCSYTLKKKFYKFFEMKEKERVEILKRRKADAFKNKYHL